MRCKRLVLVALVVGSPAAALQAPGHAVGRGCRVRTAVLCAPLIDDASLAEPNVDDMVGVVTPARARSRSQSDDVAPLVPTSGGEYQRGLATVAFITLLFA